MFIFDNKTNILIDSQELTFQSEYCCDFSHDFQNREFLDLEGLQLSGDKFEGYLSRISTDQVMFELSQLNCLTKVAGIVQKLLLGAPLFSKKQKR